MESINTMPMRNRLEFARAIANKKYEVGPRGILFPRQKTMVAGVFRSWVNGRDMQDDPNVIPVEGLNKILKSGLAVAAFIAPFTNNITPGSTITAATFDGVLAEWTGYSETTRQAWEIPADPDEGLFTNAADPAVFTSNGVATVYGAGLLTASAREATTNECYAASKFDNARALANGDKLTIQYDVNATSA